ncbi:hypothetical protein PR048_026111 [Dryococelus australis]|uniref:Uncharacterized protein n=1 Tax=Dryococelus australis TaxID=614101 RepID=A0ABQ9GKF6_9NEOP|nr:hypothetical protein PR048_026111 [Dryococelus australis]
MNQMKPTQECNLHPHLISNTFSGDHKLRSSSCADPRGYGVALCHSLHDIRSYDSMQYEWKSQYTNIGL